MRRRAPPSSRPRLRGARSASCRRHTPPRRTVPAVPRSPLGGRARTAATSVRSTGRRPRTRRPCARRRRRCDRQPVVRLHPRRPDDRRSDPRSTTPPGRASAAPPIQTRSGQPASRMRAATASAVAARSLATMPAQHERRVAGGLAQLRRRREEGPAGDLVVAREAERRVAGGDVLRRREQDHGLPSPVRDEREPEPRVLLAEDPTPMRTRRPGHARPRAARSHPQEGRSTGR